MLPKYEQAGTIYRDANGKKMNALKLFKKEGWNAMRLRLFVDPSQAPGEHKGEGVCQDLNYVENPDFEGEDTSMWVITDVNNATEECFIIDKQSDAVSGSHSFHYYTTSSEGVDCTIEQTVTGLKPGTYKFYLTLHGGGAKEQGIYIYAIADGQTYTAPAAVTDWQEFSTPVIGEITTTDGTITVGAHVITSTGGWGNLDDFVLTPVEN